MKTITLLISPLLALLLSPLFTGVIFRVKAIVAGRRGQPVVQGYYDLYRLFRKDMVFSSTTTFIFRIAPLFIFFSTIAGTLFIPIAGAHSALSFTGDIIVLLYLLGFSRFFLILSALDTGSSFEGMGASREAFFSAIAEPVMFTCLLVIMRENESFSLATALAIPMVDSPVTVLFAVVPLFILLLAENARIPFDDPNTHLELTMIHEVMILDNSGPGLALLEWAASVKLWIFASIISLVLMPDLRGNIAAQILVPASLMFLVAVTVGIVESSMARVQMSKIPRILFGAGVLAVLGFLLNISSLMDWKI